MEVISYQRYDFPNFGSKVEKDLLHVLTQDQAGLYAVYAAIVDRTKEPLRTDFLERVAHHGSKLSCTEAACSFPSLNYLNYRR